MNRHYFKMIETLAANRGLAEIADIAKQGTILHQALEKQTTSYSGARSAKEHKQAQDLIDSRKADIELQISGIAEKLKPFIIELQKEKIYI